MCQILSQTWPCCRNMHILRRELYICTCFLSVYLLVVQCDDQSDVYADGVYLGSTRSFHDMGKFTVPKSTRVIAVKGRDKNYAEGSSNNYGIIGVLNKAFRTGSHWNCSATSPVANWTGAYFDSNEFWQPATVKKGKSKENVSEELRSGDWIWGTAAHSPIYCRGIFSKFLILCIHNRPDLNAPLSLE